MKVYYFLQYLQAVFEKKFPDLNMKDPASKYNFMDACEKVFDDIVREVNDWPNPIGGHMQLYMFQHWDTFQQLGQRLRKNIFFIDDVTEVFAWFRNPMLSHAEVMSELVTLTCEKYSPEWFKKSLESHWFIKDCRSKQSHQVPQDRKMAARNYVLKLEPEQVVDLLDTLLDILKREDDVEKKKILDSIERDHFKEPMPEVDKDEIYVEKKKEAIIAVKKVLRHIVEEKITEKMKRLEASKDKNKK
ncbi:hypothetical protein AWC38_SpisGene23342 [Stylophora pistillata]|uniref:Uncharacterized protein n=1 Tax=Stylophora pistillata TaxID=50429 RepID=A0A2B4R665_STYPI|nr:hypothetical protein AWC38_SpisGene23342 [Stylophora pistillata]